MSDESAPHSLEEKLAQGHGGRGDTAPRRTLESLRACWGFREEVDGDVSICPMDRRSVWRRESGSGLKALYVKVSEQLVDELSR